MRFLFIKNKGGFQALQGETGKYTARVKQKTERMTHEKGKGEITNPPGTGLFRLFL